MSEHLKITVVTPNYNGAHFLERTIVSVLSQNYPNLEYIVVDGNSSDSSMKIIGKYAGQIARVISEPDKGHADAVNKGFSASSGVVMGWINSDDMLFPGSLALVNEVFSEFPDVEWITGRATTMLESDIVNVVRDARPWSWLRFLCGDYRHIQQESTFWRRGLWDRAGGGLSLRYSYANDFDLWARFFRHALLHTVDGMVGCFRYREGQRSVASRSHYDEECDRILESLLDSVPAGLLARHLALLPAKRTLHQSSNFPSLPPALAIADAPIIRYDFQKRKFSRNALPLDPPSAFFPKETIQEDLDFDGSESVVWTSGPDFTLSELVGLDMEFSPRQGGPGRETASPIEGPSMPIQVGPVALYETGPGSYQLRMQYERQIIRHDMTLDPKEAVIRLKVALADDRYAVIANGRTVAAGSVTGRQVAQGTHARIGGGQPSRCWAGKVERLFITVRTRTARGEPNTRNSGIIHATDKRNLARERNKRS